MRSVAPELETQIMRSVGLMLVSMFAAVALVQAQPPLPPAAPPAAPPANSALDEHLARWEAVMGRATNFSAKFDLTRTSGGALKAEHKYAGQFLCMKPNLARLSIGSTTKKNDFEAYICNGKSLYEYDWGSKKITEIPLGPGGGDSLMLDFLQGMTAKAARQRFQIELFNPTDKNYVYFDIKPTLAKDKQEFEHIRFALYGPGVPAGFTPYLPSQMYMLKPNGDTELWKFTDQQIDVKGITPAVFQYEEPKEKGWQYEKVKPPSSPTGAAPPKGGAVRPSK